jgi:hypothetical protein
MRDSVASEMKLTGRAGIRKALQQEEDERAFSIAWLEFFILVTGH